MHQLMRIAPTVFMTWFTSWKKNLTIIFKPHVQPYTMKKMSVYTIRGLALTRYQEGQYSAQILVFSL